MKKNVAILTTFYKWDESYSLTGVVKHQIYALLKHGYDVTLFVLKSFDYEEQNDLLNKFTELLHGVRGAGVLSVSANVPQITTEPYQGIARHHNIPESFERDVDVIMMFYNRYLSQHEIVLTHDIIFQDSFLAYNAALRQMRMSPDQRFFHWMHSGPSTRPYPLVEPVSFLYTLPPQSTLIYMNEYGIVGAAEMYGLYPSRVRIVHNPIDYRLLSHVHPAVRELIEEYELYEKDVIAVYPLSTTRMDKGGKQISKAIKVMSSLKRLGLKVALVVPNAHANADQEKAAVAEMRLWAQEQGLGLEDLIFTSTLGNGEYEHGFPHEAVMQLFQYSDLFLFPSVSENCPLILLEAAIGKNLLVLNEDFSPMKEFVGSSALYFKFDSVTTTTHHPMGEDVYYADVAKIIAAELKPSRMYQASRKIRQQYNVDYVFQTELEPLFVEEFADDGN